MTDRAPFADDIRIGYGRFRHPVDLLAQYLMDELPFFHAHGWQVGLDELELIGMGPGHHIGVFFCHDIAPVFFRGQQVLIV